MIFIGLELTGLSLYVMTAFDKTDIRSAEAGLKYFLFGSTASAFTLFGLSLVYGMCGTTGLAAIGQQLGSQTCRPLLAAGIVMTLVGFVFKIAAAPFHLWAPDAYQGCANSQRRLHRFRIESRVVRCPRKNCARWLRPDARQRRLARDGRRLGAAPGRARRALDRDRQFCRARANESAPPPRLFRCRARRLHSARPRRRRARGIFRDLVLHHGLRFHASRRFRRRRAGAARNRRRRFEELRRPARRARHCSPGAWRSSCFR